MKRVLVTGGTGFVGSNLVRRLLRDGHDIHLLARPGYTSWRISDIERTLRLYPVDLRDGEGIQRAVRCIRPEWIFHLSAYGGYSVQDNLETMVQTNISGTMHLVNACIEIGFEAFVHTGSSSEYGFKDHPPTETAPLEPNSDYAVTKAAATLFCQSKAQRLNLNISTLRLYSVYGPFEDTSRLIPVLILKGRQGTWPPLVNPDIARDFVYVDDVVDACLLATRSGRIPGGIYNVGTGIQKTIREVVAVAKKRLNISGEPPWGSMQNRLWDAKTWVADIRNIREKLGWSPLHTFEQGFDLTIEWFVNKEISGC